jgi:hypothetical protein
MTDQFIEWGVHQLEHQITATGTLADSHPDQLVPTCDPWTMRDLTEHFLQLARRVAGRRPHLIRRDNRLGQRVFHST